jgi:hypothetical protein
MHDKLRVVGNFSGVGVDALNLIIPDDSFYFVVDTLDVEKISAIGEKRHSI